MTFDKKTFQTRALTAVVFVIIMLGGLFLHAWSFFILFSVIHFGCWIEFQRLVGLIDKEYQKITPFHKYGVMMAGWCIMLWFTTDDYHLFGLRLHELGWWMGLLFIFVLPIMELMLASHVRLKNIAHSAFGLIYISLSLGFIMDLRKDFFLAEVNIDYIRAPEWHRIVLPAAIIFAIWINDTFAYIIGSLIGKTPFSKISPKKTWEGTMGGVLLALIISWIIARLFDFHIPNLVIIAGIASIAGIFGDLLESKLKRMAGVKDSGSLMPGHGGFLDRFDSMLVAIPFVWLYAKIFLT